MPTEHDWSRVDADDPNRCQAQAGSRGQCYNKVMEHSKFCPAHGGNRANAAGKEASKRIYMAELWRERIAAMEDHSKLKTLSSEIGILRMMLDARLKLCTTEMDLAIHASSIGELISKIEKLVTSCDRLDTRLGGMLDTTQAMAWMTDVVEIISRHVEDSDVLSLIADEILESFQKIQKG